MKYCIYCGQKLEDDAEYCSKCGKKQSGKTEDNPNNKTNSKSDVELIKKYLKGASEIEWSLYSLECIKKQLLDRLNDNINEQTRLQKVNKDQKDRIANLEKQLRNQAPAVYKPVKMRPLDLGYDLELYTVVTIGFWVAAVVADFLKIGPFPEIFNRFANWLSVVKYGRIIAIIFAVIFPSLLVFAGQTIWWLIEQFLQKLKDKRERVKFEQASQKHMEEQISSLKSEIQQKKDAVKSNEEKINQIANGVQPALNQEIIRCNDAIAEAEESLADYYEPNVIHMNYRALVPVSTMYEYFDSGRVDSLTGHEGAYNLYESELKMRVIIGYLDEISSKLDRISANQQAILNRLNSIDSQVNSLMNSVDMANQKNSERASAISTQLFQLQYSTDLSNYYSKQNSMMLQQIKAMKAADYYSHHLI